MAFTNNAKSQLSRDLNLKPLISVGMPVYNEEKYLRDSVESILNQDYNNFELIISDNASLDKTEQICLELTRKNNRIKYIRNRNNIGAIENFYQVFREANGEYFMFAGGHDLWSHNFMSNCLKALQDSPKTVLSFSSTVWIDEYNNKINKESSFYDTRGCDPVTRFLYVLWGPMNPIYGLIRMDALNKVRINIQILGADLIILSELSFLGQFAYIPDAIWHRRMINGEEPRKQKIERYKRNLFSKSNILSNILPHIKIPFELLRSIFKAKMSLKDKICIFVIAIVSSPIKYYIANK